MIRRYYFVKIAECLQDINKLFSKDIIFKWKT